MGKELSKDIDITDEEFDELHVPYSNNLHSFMIKYIIPETFAFELANSHSRGCLCNATIGQHYNSMIDIFNGFQKYLNDIKVPTIELLMIKYNLKMIYDILFIGD